MSEKLIEKKIEYATLFDVYGSLLTKKQQDILSYYFFEDLSYNEIADLQGISKQAIHDTINKAIKKLNHYEENIGYLRLKEEYDTLINRSDSEESEL